MRLEVSPSYNLFRFAKEIYLESGIVLESNNTVYKQRSPIYPNNA